MEDPNYMRRSTCVHGTDVSETCQQCADEVRQYRDSLDPAKLRQRIAALEAVVQGFLDYYDPRGGVSQVPLGPFERARAAVGKVGK